MKKFTTMLLAVVMCLSCMTTVFAEEGAPQTVSEKLERIENYVYGATQNGSLVSRVDNAEKDLFGAASTGPVMSRVDNLNSALNDANGATPSFVTMLNAVEWQFADRMSVGPAKSRIEHLEQTINGSTDTTGSLKSRLDALTASAFPAGSLTSSAVILPKDSLIKVRFMNEISSKTSKAGEEVDFIVDDNVYVGEALVLPKGSKGYGTIKKIVQPRIFGRDARIDLDFSHVTAVDGRRIPVYIGELAKQEAKTAAGAAGASIGGMILFGPVGVVGGAFVKGQSVAIPADSCTYVQVTDDININGVVQGAGKPVAATATTAKTTEATAESTDAASNDEEASAEK